MAGNNAPLEMLASPYEVFITTGSDAFTAPSATPSGGWVKMGNNGVNNMVEGGVTVASEQTLVEHYVEGRTEPAKVTRSRERAVISFALNDMRGDLYRHALSSGAAGMLTVTTTNDAVGLSRSLDVSEVRLLIRGASPTRAGYNAQFEIPRAVQIGNPAPVFSKGELAATGFEFLALADLSASTTGERIGRFLDGGQQ